MSEQSEAGRDLQGGWSWGPWSQVGAITAVVTFLADQAHKWWMILGVGMKPGDRFDLLPFLQVIYVKNTGISYSMFDSDSTAWQLALAGFALVVCLALWIWLARTAESLLFALSLGLIIGGALGNGLDRILLGGVADFFLLHANGYSWYVFNVADIAIVAGVIGLLYDSFVPSRNGAAKTS